MLTSNDMSPRQVKQATGTSIVCSMRFRAGGLQSRAVAAAPRLGSSLPAILGSGPVLFPLPGDIDPSARSCETTKRLTTPAASAESEAAIPVREDLQSEHRGVCFRL
ncbi:unnamed protein product [Symbiodinium sp. CCMP2592]|nr:unnamed protein product [Symbiodinium sp. CCMP2592]